MALTLPIDLSHVHAVYAFTSAGWLVLFLSMLVLYASHSVLVRLVAHGHILRRKAQLLASKQSEPLPQGNSQSSPDLNRQGTKASLAKMTARSELDALEWHVAMGQHEVRLEELAAAVRTQRTPSLMQSLSAGFRLLHELHEADEEDGFDAFEEDAEGQGEEGSRPQNGKPASKRSAGFCGIAGAASLWQVWCGSKPPPGGRLLTVLPEGLQICMVLASLLQALVVTMLGRDYLLLLSNEGEAGPHDHMDATGAWQGACLIVATIVPTLIQSLVVVPRALRNIALAHAAAHHDAEVLHELETEFVQSGDYVAANEALELAASSKLSDEDMQDEMTVRAKVRDLCKLGEMRWRYRVVDQGQSPRDEAIKLLEEAKTLIETRCQLMRRQPSRSRSFSERFSGHSPSPPASQPLLEPTTSGSRSGVEIPEEWADEMAEVLQGLAVARLIFNPERTEDTLIASLLKTALELRELIRDAAKMADTLNSIGSLRQKQHNFKDAEANFAKALELRRGLKRPTEGGEGFEKTKAQAVAQSLTSLGTLLLVMADESEVKPEEALAAEQVAARKASRAAHLNQALKHLTEAKEMYIKGFHSNHPKVAWALEGLAKAHQKNGNFREAEADWEGAIVIRNSAQESSSGKQMFSEELASAQQAQEEISARRAGTRKRWGQPLLHMMVANAMVVERSV